MLKVLDVDGAVRRVSGGWTATGQDWAYDADRYAAGRRRAGPGAAGHARLPRHRPAAGWSTCAASWTTPAPQPCGRCDNCTGRPGRHQCPRPAPRPPRRAAAAARHRGGAAQDVADGHERARASTVSGRIAPAVQAQPGRAVARLTDLGWGPRLRAAAGPPAGRRPGPGRPGRGRGQGPGRLGLGRAARPRWSTLPSRSRPQLVASLASQIAAIGRAALRSARSTTPPSGRLASRGPRNGVSTTAPSGCARSGTSWPCPRRWPRPRPPLGGPVLLVDDRIETGWTMTVAAKLLREAGAAAVLPLALASSG